MKLFRLLSLRVCNKKIAGMAGLPRTTPTKEEYDMKRVLVVSKNTRYQYEMKNHPDFSAEELNQYLIDNGSEHYVKTHQNHKKFEEKVINALEKFNVEVKLVQRYDLSENLINWADTIISVGGDGTYLMAANGICDQSKPLIGFNSCPETSTGFLCLPKSCSRNVFKTVEQIKNRRFTWAYRTRIHITFHGHDIDKKWKSIHENSEPKEWNVNRLDQGLNESRNYVNEEYILPHLALNEVFLSESSPANVSFMDISIDNGQLVKTKSSGIIVCTGSGSTSWNFTMNRISKNVVKQIFDISGLKADVELIADQYNNSLRFPQDDARLHFTIRDLIPTATWPKMPSVPENGFTTKVKVNSIMRDGSLIIDGSISYPLRLGTTAIMESSPKYSLKTINMEYID